MKLFNNKTRLRKFFTAPTTYVLLCICCLSFSPEDDSGKFKYFAHYSQFQIDTINKHWNQFFNIEISKTLDPSLDLFSLKLDGYGCIYPDDNILEGVTEQSFLGANPTSDQKCLTFYTLFRNDPQIETNIQKLPRGKMKSLYTDLLHLAHKDDVDSFTDKWDDFFVERYMQKLKEKLGSKKHILFFIHGYNVPYSLATVQCIQFLNLTRELKINTDDYVIVPVYWPSNNEKEHVLYEQGFNTSDKIVALDGWRYYSNRAYYAAFTLRQILNGLEHGISVKIFSHSLGATVATTALINTQHKLDTKYPFAQTTAFNKISPKDKKKLKNGESVTYDFLKLMDKHKLPTNTVTVFMNAPAMPGYNTFIDMDSIAAKNFTFYVGWNESDRMVGKFKILTPAMFGSTTLGANAPNEMDLVEGIFVSQKLQGHFNPDHSGSQVDHDIFMYYLNNDFREILTAFMQAP